MDFDYKIQILKKATSQTTARIFSLIKQLVPDATKLSVDRLNQILTDKSCVIFVALNNENRIIGMITIISFYNVQNIHLARFEDLVVDSSYRRKGIGKALVKKALLKAKELKIDWIHLTSAPHRKAANQLYKNLGFYLHKTNYYKYKIK